MPVCSPWAASVQSNSEKTTRCQKDFTGETHSNGDAAIFDACDCNNRPSGKPPVNSLSTRAFRTFSNLTILSNESHYLA